MIHSSPFASPFVQPFAQPFASNQPVIPVSQPLPQPPELSLSRALNYYADYSGCGFWRMIWPEHLLNAHQKMIVHGSTVMILDPNYYRDWETDRKSVV